MSFELSELEPMQYLKDPRRLYGIISVHIAGLQWGAEITVGQSFEGA